VLSIEARLIFRARRELSQCSSGFFRAMELASRLHHAEEVTMRLTPHQEETHVLNKCLLTALAAACSGTLLAAQAPAPQSSQVQADKRAVTTITGCVYRESDIPGRAPNPAERVGISEDYILAEIAGAAGSSGARAPGATGTTGAGGAAATGTAGVGRMYKLEKVDDSKLKSLIGKRVEVSGILDAEAGDSKAAPGGATTSTTDQVVGRDRIDLSEFEVASIKEVPGACPAMRQP
jgi:hypothetical protein